MVTESLGNDKIVEKRILLSWLFDEYGKIMETFKKIRELGNIFITSSFSGCIYREEWDH